MWDISHRQRVGYKVIIFLDAAPCKVLILEVFIWKGANKISKVGNSSWQRTDGLVGYNDVMMTKVNKL